MRERDLVEFAASVESTYFIRVKMHGIPYKHKYIRTLDPLAQVENNGSDPKDNFSLPTKRGAHKPPLHYKQRAEDVDPLISMSGLCEIHAKQ